MPCSSPCQVTKIGLRDFSMKDYILVGSKLRAAASAGSRAKEIRFQKRKRDRELYLRIRRALSQLSPTLPIFHLD